jgi:hypothetical protein
MYDLAASRAKLVLKCFYGPARTVRPEVNPPFTLPENAILIAGISVVTKSFSVKNFESCRI